MYMSIPSAVYEITLPSTVYGITGGYGGYAIIAATGES